MDAFQRHFYRYLLLAVIFVLSIGTIFYHLVEGWTWVNAYYFSVVTLATVGYGDYTPKTIAGKIFTTFYIMAGVGILTAFFSFSMRRMKERAQKREEKKKL